MRGRIFFIIAIVAFVAVVPLVYYLLFERGLSVETMQLPDASVDAGEEQPPLPMALSIIELDGKVDHSRESPPKSAWSSSPRIASAPPTTPARY
jgi:hypothetical protein